MVRPWYQLNRRMGGPRAGLDHLEKKSLFPGIEPKSLRCEALRVVILLNEVSWLHPLYKKIKLLEEFLRS
jgi:hypothetical protein